MDEKAANRKWTVALQILVVILVVVIGLAVGWGLSKALSGT